MDVVTDSLTDVQAIHCLHAQTSALQSNVCELAPGHALQLAVEPQPSKAELVDFILRAVSALQPSHAAAQQSHLQGKRPHTAHHPCT